MTAIKALVCAVGLMGCAAVLSAQSKTVTKHGETIKVTTTIQAIDTTARRITFRDADGTEDTVYAGPEVQRFNELKVGDQVTLTYYESTVYQLRKGGTSKMATEAGSVIPGGGKMPGGTMARQTIQTVTVKSVDPAVPSITVTTANGRTVTRKVDKKSYLNGVKPGDKIDITYTEALLASVERPK
jgi:hypothetical protein